MSVVHYAICIAHLIVDLKKIAQVAEETLKHLLPNNGDSGWVIVQTGILK